MTTTNELQTFIDTFFAKHPPVPKEEAAEANRLEALTYLVGVRKQEVEDVRARLAAGDSMTWNSDLRTAERKYEEALADVRAFGLSK